MKLKIIDITKGLTQELEVTTVELSTPNGKLGILEKHNKSFFALQENSKVLYQTTATSPFQSFEVVNGSISVDEDIVLLGELANSKS